MKHVILISIQICFYIIIGTSIIFAQTDDEKAGVFYFDFRDGSDMYECDYRGNNIAFKQLEDFILPEDSWYLLLEVFVKEGDEADLFTLNQKIFRAAVLRSQLRAGLDIPYDRIAFYIRKEDHFFNSIRITVVKQQLSHKMNTDIFYSLSSLPAHISSALSRYEQLPFYDLDDYEDEPVIAPEKTVDQVQNIVKMTEPAPKVNEDLQPMVRTGKLPPGAYPFNLGIKTMLLPWMGIVPVWGLGDGDKSKGYSHGAPMYNGALEYYFADRYSLEASFLYAYSTYGGKKDNLWGISFFALEPRFWFNPDNSFRKFHIGMRAEYGDFDMKTNTPVNYGKTGRFYSAAFTVGYTQPIYRNFLVEGGVSLGYRNMYDGKNYRYDSVEKKNFYEGGFSEGTFVVGLSVSLLYRLGFW